MRKAGRSSLGSFIEQVSGRDGLYGCPQKTLSIVMVLRQKVLTLPSTVSDKKRCQDEAGAKVLGLRNCRLLLPLGSVFFSRLILSKC